MYEVSTEQLLKIYSLCCKFSKFRKMPTLVGLNDFSHTVTAPLNFHKQVQSRRMSMPTIPTAKKNREQTSYSNKITVILSEH